MGLLTHLSHMHVCTHILGRVFLLCPRNTAVTIRATTKISTGTKKAPMVAPAMTPAPGNKACTDNVGYTSANQQWKYDCKLYINCDHTVGA